MSGLFNLVLNLRVPLLQCLWPLHQRAELAMVLERRIQP